MSVGMSMLEISSLIRLPARNRCDMGRSCTVYSLISPGLTGTSLVWSWAISQGVVLRVVERPV